MNDNNQLKISCLQTFSGLKSAVSRRHISSSLVLFDVARKIRRLEEYKTICKPVIKPWRNTKHVYGSSLGVLHATSCNREAGPSTRGLLRSGYTSRREAAPGVETSARANFPFIGISRSKTLSYRPILCYLAFCFGSSFFFPLECPIFQSSVLYFHPSAFPDSSFFNIAKSTNENYYPVWQW